MITYLMFCDHCQKVIHGDAIYYDKYKFCSLTCKAKFLWNML